jgi:hypothetical protein
VWATRAPRPHRPRLSDATACCSGSRSRCRSVGARGSVACETWSGGRVPVG